MEQDQFLEEGEVMIEGIRKHWIVYVEDSIIHALGCLLFILFAGFILKTGYIPFFNDTYKSYITMIFIFFMSITWVSYFYFWTKNYFDVWYVTDRHIVAINQKDMFLRESAFMELIKIQDISFEKNGFLSTFLGYGKLKVQTAGSDQEFVIEDVSDVEAVTLRIMELRDSKLHT